MLKNMIAEIVINRSAKKLNRTFDYGIPKDLEELLNIIKNKRGFDDTQMAIYMKERNLVF